MNVYLIEFGYHYEESMFGECYLHEARAVKEYKNIMSQVEKYRAELDKERPRYTTEWEKKAQELNAKYPLGMEYEGYDYVHLRTIPVDEKKISDTPGDPGFYRPKVMKIC